MKPVLYTLYGLAVRSSLPLNAPRLRAGDAAVTISPASRSYFKRISPEIPGSKAGIFYRPLADHSIYIRFFGFMRFHVSADGRRIAYETLSRFDLKKTAAPLVFLQTNVLSFSLLKRDTEVLHASAVVFREKAVAFLGESGYGKSTTAASLMKAGCSLLTDDLLVIRKKSGRFSTPHGIPHIKLWPKAAKAMAAGLMPAGKMNPTAQKLILSLPHTERLQKDYPVGLLYILWPRFGKGSREIRIRKLKPMEGAISLIKSSHNLVLQDAVRLRRQMDFTAELAKRVHVRAVSFPRHFGRITALRKKLLRDMERFL